MEKCNQNFVIWITNLVICITAVIKTVEVHNEIISTASYIQTGDSYEGPKLKKKHQEEEETLDGKKPDLPAHNSIADTLLCSICQV